MKKWLLLCLILFLLPFGDIGQLQAAKKNSDGENLNFAPTVDFELKEKKKVDVIVDVGNTTYTVDQVNSYINESLRPQLQASGLDYKIHVEKSSEGATRIYYFTAAPNTTSPYTALYYYDVLTKQHVFVKETGLTNINEAYYDPNSDLIFVASIESGYNRGNVYVISPNERASFTNKPIDFKNNTGTFGGATYINGKPQSIAITSDGYLLTIRQYDFVGSVYKATSASKISDITSMIQKNQNVEVDAGRLLYTDKTDVLMAGNEGSVYFINYASSMDTGNYTRSLNRYTNFQEVYSSPNNQATLNSKSVSFYFQPNGLLSTMPITMGYFKGTSEMLFAEAIVSDYSRVYQTQITKYNPTTNTKTIFADPISSSGGSSAIIFPLDDNEMIYRFKASDPVYYYEDYTSPTTRKEINSPKYNNTVLYPTTYAGRTVAFGGTLYNRPLSFYDLDTGYTETINNQSYYYVAKYPQWYTAKKRYITDILNEVPYRAGAEKFYVRLDDQGINHLNNTTRLGKTIEALSKQNVEYIGIGNENNRDITTKIQTALGQNKQYSISNPTQAFASLATYITDRKEVDLHVLIGETSLSLDTIKTSVNGLVTTMKDKNINVTPHYVVGNSVLQGLLNDVKWNEDKNSYVLLVQQGKMEDMNVEQAQEEVVNLILGKYAHLLHLGSSNNRVIGEKLVQLLELNGFYVNGGTLTANLQKTAAYIEQTAVSNPKRISNVLVLQHDPSTGEYSSEITLQTFYDDFESDKKRNERFKTTHDPTVYENHTGVMSGIGQYQEVPTTKFTKVGLYEMVVQVQDEPIADSRLSEYWLWSKDSLSRLKLYVHRQPVAEFSATVNASKKLTITDYSYDLDRYSRVNKGITTWEWKWKRVEDSQWTEGTPPQTLAANTDYLISLKVKDIDAAWSNETIRFVTTHPYNQPPVALFTVDPAMISHRASSTITDLSYDPDGDAIISREWIVTKDNVELWNATTQPTVAQLKTAATGKGLSVLGTYILQLRVQDTQNQISEWAKGSLEVVNYPPIADFEPLTETYRDTLNKVTNLTKNPDLDGDTVSYEWQLSYKGKTYPLGTAKDPSFTIKSLGLGKNSVGTWNLQLKASDPLGAYSYMSYDFDVVNQQPSTEITSGRATGYINVPYAYTSSGTDPDTEDVASLQSYWKLTTPSGKVHQWYTKDISITYTEKGDFTLDHWVVDQLGEKSTVKTMKIKVLNQLPIPGFKMNPNPTYRGENVSIISEATDYDGYIEEHKYYVTLPNGTTGLLSDLADFKKVFSTVGKLQIRQVVTDNDGASAEITKELEILNRPPEVIITDPVSASRQTPTIYQTNTPRITWIISDDDQDAQVQYRLTLKSSDGLFTKTSGAITSNLLYFDVPKSWGLTENTIYEVTVQVNDGYVWSRPSSTKYFKIVLNQPPTAGFIWSPSSIWEGDTVNIQHQVLDSDFDQLQVSYTVQAPDGETRHYPSNKQAYLLDSKDYSSAAFQLAPVKSGNYRITQNVTDGKSEVISLTKTMTVGELNVVGKVAHTTLWEQYRQRYNEQIGTTGNTIWQEDQFYAGEKLMLQAETTDTKSSNKNITYAKSVSVTFIKDNTELAEELTNKWRGSLWKEHFSELKNGKYEVHFTATYSNGVVKSDVVTIEIIGKAASFVSVHRWK